MIDPTAFIRAIGLIKASCALTNQDLGELKPEMAAAIAKAAVAVAAGEHDGEFIVDVFQTGSGTSSNMNGNEVIATLASRALEKEVHPNDHVNMSQSSNDVRPRQGLPVVLPVLGQRDAAGRCQWHSVL